MILHKFPKVTKASAVGLVITMAIALIVGSWLAQNYDIALYTITNPSDVRATKVVREYLQKKANADFLKELSIK